MDICRRQFCCAALASLFPLAIMPTPADCGVLRYPTEPAGSVRLSRLCGINQNSTTPNLVINGRSIGTSLSPVLYLVSQTLGIRPKVALTDDNSRPIMEVGSLLGSRNGILCLNDRYVSAVLSSGAFSHEIFVGVIAHEFAHIMQIRNDCYLKLALSIDNIREGLAPCSSWLYPSGNQYFAELHADYMSGWVLGKLNILTIDSFSGYCKHLFDDGDAFIDQRDHHGTPRERLNAMATGFEYARTGEVNGYEANELLYDRRGSSEAHPDRSAIGAFRAGQAYLAGRKVLG